MSIVPIVNLASVSRADVALVGGKNASSGEMIGALATQGIRVICPLLSGPISILELATKEEWNGKEAQAGGDYRQAA